VIVGAGPAGSTAARDAARRGLSVLLLEKRQEIGSPVRCAEGIAHDLLVDFIEPDPRWIAAPVTQERVIVVQGGQEREALFADDGVRLWVDDRLFVDQWQDQTAPYSADVSLTQGYHRVRLEYYERGGAAAMRLNWAASR
jgi:digeranylgeranylglycerophospholipid reductase